MHTKCCRGYAMRQADASSVGGGVVAPLVGTCGVLPRVQTPTRDSKHSKKHIPTILGWYIRYIQWLRMCAKRRHSIE